MLSADRFFHHITFNREGGKFKAKSIVATEKVPSWKRYEFYLLAFYALSTLQKLHGFVCLEMKRDALCTTKMVILHF